MKLAIIYTVVLVLTFVSFLLSHIANMIPVAVKLLPILAIGVLWIYTLVFKLQNKMGFGGVILLIVYYLIFVVVLLSSLGLNVIGYFDKEKYIPPHSLGNLKSEKQIVIVYHPGGSEFTTRVLNQFGGMFKNTRYQIVLQSAHHNLQLNLKKTVALGLASPVYAGFIRPALEDFIQSHNLKGIKTFIIITGGEPKTKEIDLKRVSELLEAKGAIVLDKIKIIQKNTKEDIESDLNKFSLSIIKKLK